LAYGQTGSGKTYTMGGAYAINVDGIEEMTGIIPRVVRDLYSGMEKRNAEFEFTVKISYLEVWIAHQCHIIFGSGTDFILLLILLLFFLLFLRLFHFKSD